MLPQLKRSEIRQIVQTLDDDTAEALLCDWELWARPEQLPPDGDWYVWMILAGRGWGKTRTGAEYIRYRVEQCGARRIGLIGQTSADVRDVIVEGESGVLAVSPKWNRPVYEPSKRRLTWPNGAVATTYAGDSPDQLRGPQHDTVWCLAGETLVLMQDGTQKELAAIRTGDYVQTRQGPKRVTMQALTKQNATVYLLHTMDGQSIIGTADHPVWVTGKGFTPLASIMKGESVCVTHASATTTKPGTNGSQRATTTLLWLCSIAQFGRPHMAQFPKGRISTISTAIKQITGLIISNSLPIVNIARSTIQKSWHRTKSAHTRTQLQQERTMPQNEWNRRLPALFVATNIIALLRTQQATVHPHVSKSHDLVRFRVSSGNVSIVGSNTTPRSEHSVFVQGSVIHGHLGLGLCLWSHAKSLVRSVACSLFQSDRTRNFAAGHAPCVTTQTIASVERLATRRDVYDIAVEGAREFFANGILVHNCDELAKWRYAQECWDNMEMGLRLGSDPRAIVTTTPRPIPLILTLRSDPQTVRPTSNLSTHINRANVSGRFVERVLKKYSGTRLGRQELDAEILEDTPGALWTRSGIEATRVHPRDLPELIRIVVGVDPSAGGVDGETGIVGAGKDANEHGYLLRDATESGDPAVWAPAVIRTYIELQADAIVVETNNGGKMIAHVIRQTTVEIGGVLIRGANLPIIEVWASRGKHTRAEPISMLWSQGRGHYVGAWPELEDQCCTWVPGEQSPDRMDAKVWALTELFPNEEGGEADFAPTVGGSRSIATTIQRGRR